MAEIFNNRVCVFANEIISLNTKRKIGSENGFLSEGTFSTMRNRKQILIVRRSTPGSSALVDFETMRPDIKNKYVQLYGDPRAEIAVKTQKSALEEAIVYSNAAYKFFSVKYQYDNGKKLPPEKIDEYTLHVRIMDALLMLRDSRKMASVGGGGTRINIWERLCKMSNDLLSLKDPNGRSLFPHKLPQNWKSLKRKCEKYEEARGIGEEEGFHSVIHKSYGNKFASLVKDEESEAIMHKLISLHNNLNSIQIMEEYNKIAEVLDKPLISSPVTVDNYKKKMELTTMQGRKGKKAIANTRKMQIHREAPTQALTYWTLDGWTAELLYQKKVPAGKGADGQRYMKTTYTNRKTIVYVMDACCKYPVGYAIGDNESPELIREALRNAVRHTKELFGKRYKPLQLQSDNYAKKTLTPFYQAMTKYYTPAAVGNAKAKIIEPHFHYLNVQYCQKQANWSGFGITSRTENQPNVEALNEHRKLVPDETTCINQIEAIVAQERAKHLEGFMAAWERTEEARKLPFSDEEYLLLMGETTGRTNHINGDGLRLEMHGERINYDTFDMSLRDHYNEDWIVRYDPDDMGQVLISNAVRKGLKDAGKEIGTFRYIMQRCMKAPMALVDQKPEHFEYRNKVGQFNEGLQQHINDKVASVDGHIKNLQQRIPELINNTLLDRYLLTDSKGQHKDARSKMRDEVEDTDFEDVTGHIPKAIAVAANDEDEDYSFNPSDMNFSR